MTELALPGGGTVGTSSVAYGVNNQGVAAGRGGTCPSGPEAVVWIGSSVQCLGTSGGTISWAFAVNEANVVVGWSENAAGVNRPFRWSAGTGKQELAARPGGLSIASDVNDFGQIAGAEADPSGSSTVPIVWEADGTRRELPIPTGFSSASASGVNNRGDVVGNASGSVDTPSRAFVWTAEGDVLDLGAFTSQPFTWANAISDNGFVAGAAGPDASSIEIALWTLDLPTASTGQALESLSSGVQLYQSEGLLSSGEATALLRLLTQAESSVEAGNQNAAVGQLSAFVQRLEAMVRSGSLNEAQARPLREAAQEAINGLR